ncbi:MAG: bifunctional DNA-formamidopyrimidine glycosylase/DNA-(apurinic or apyrimidinic site) lyase, partial [Kiritimatiellales bacterium]|nr:bifunctional DNA-formamidopyrimidine glycosylase/DNA-(apurinic or apyrimidinic site) lyase [Kiritimatiellales bacterium]
PEEFARKITGKTIEAVSRHGKWLIIELDDIDNLLVHLRMTGGFSFIPGPHDRVVFHLSGGMNLYFKDPRKFGRMKVEPFPLGLGPDAMEITPRPFFQTLEKTGRKLKPLLLDQSFIAGVGNIYADEALFRARLRPDRRASTLTEKEALALYYAITDVINEAIENGGTSLGDGQGNYVDLNGNSGGHSKQAQVYGRAGEPCVICKQPLHKIQIARRTTVFCEHCQK